MATSLDRMAVYLSGTQTGTSSEQSLVHGLGCIPGFVVVQPTDEEAANVVIGTHTSSVVKVTVANGETYKLAAFALAS